MSKSSKTSIQLKFEASFHHLVYVKSNLEYHRVEHQRRRELFYSDLDQFINEHNFEVSEEKSKKNLIDIYKKNKCVTVSKIDKHCKLIFKKIAKQTHPDLSPSEEKLAMFIKARNAIDESDWFSLYQIALLLNIRIPDVTTVHVKWMEEEAKKANALVSTIVNTLEWLYFEEASNKEHIMTNYCMATCNKK